MTTISKTKGGLGRYIALALIALLIAGTTSPLSAFAAISPLPSGSVADGGGAEQSFKNDEGQYSTWESPSSGFAVSPDYAYRFKQSDATFTPFGKLDNKGGDEATDDHGYPAISHEDYYIFPVSSGDNTKGKVGMDVTGLKIRNPKTGVYDLVDMKVTVSDWELVSGGKQPYIYVQKHSRTNIVICDVKEAKVQFEYFVAGTNRPYSIKANLSYNDIDNQQYIGVKPSDVIYMYADKNSKLSYAKVDGYFVYYAAGQFGNDTSGTPKLAMGITYQTSRLDMVFGTNENLSDGESWSYFGQYSYSMASIAPGAPVKLVSDSDEKDVVDNRLKTPEETFTYKVVQPIPAGLSDNMFYDTFKFEDQIDTCLLIEDVSVKQESHGDRTDWFTITQAGNHVIATAKASALKDEDFYGGSKRNDTEFTLTVKVRIDPAKSEQMKTHGGGTGHYNASGDLLTFENTASTTIKNNVDTYVQDTNKVTTRVALPGKNVSDSDEDKVSSDRIVNANESFIYRVYQKILDGMDGTELKYRSFVLSDTVDSCVKVTGARVIRDDNTDVSGLFDLSVIGANVTASAKTASLAEASFYGSGNGTGYTLLIEAALDQTKTYAELKAHGHYNAAEDELIFPNKATVTIDDSPMTSNEVTTKVGVPDLSIAKSAHRYEHQVGDRVKYTVTVRHTDKSTSDATSVVVRDASLPAGFEIDFESLEVSGIATQNYSFEAVQSGFIFKTDLIAKTETAIVTYDAIPDKRHNGKIVDNTVSVTAYSMTSEKKASASVYINSPKLNILKETHKAEYKVGDTISYRLTLTQINPGTFMRDVIVTDNITHGGVTLLPGSIQVMDSENKIITHLCDITIGGNAFTVITHLNMGYGDRAVPPKEKGIAPYSSLALENRIVVTYDVAVQSSELSGKSVINTAIAPTRPNTYGDLIKNDPDIPSGGDEKKKDTPLVGAKLRIDKSSDKEIYEVYDTAKYTLKVTQLREDYTAKNVTVRDVLDTTFAAIIPGSVTVTLNKRDISSGCAITVSGAALEVATNKDLAWGDTLLIKYDVSFLPDAEGAVIVNAAFAGADNAEETQDENTVGIEPGTAKLAIVKESDKTEYIATETAIYTLTATCVSSASATDVIISDKLDSISAAIGADSIKIMLGKADITSECDITSSDQDFRIETGKALKEGESITVTYEVTFDPAYEGGRVKNTAIASSSNSDEVRDENEINVSPLMDEDEATPAAIEPEPTESDTPDPGEDFGSPKTGDSFNPVAIIVLIIGLAGIASSFIYRRKHAKK